MKNNVPLGLVGGLVTAIIGAAIWATITVVTGYQIGWLAVGVGILVGYGVRLLGKGYTSTFGAIGAIFAFLGCFLGNFLALIGLTAKEFELEFFTILTEFDYSQLVSIMTETTEPMDFLFYAIAIWEGYKFGKIEGEDIDSGHQNTD